MRATRIPFLCSVAALGLWPVAPVVAAEPAPATATADANPAGDIVVTARKREERLQDVPVAVSAFTSQDLLTRGIRDISDVALFTPGFSMQNIQAGTEQPFIRGQSTTSFDRTLQTSSSFVDGNYFSVLGRTIFFPDLERVEVIRGPQAALFGRATFAGAVNYVTKSPSNELGAEVRFLAGTREQLQGHGSISGPLIKDVLMFRISATDENFGGQYANQPSTEKTGRTNHYGFTGALRWLPANNLTIDLKGFQTYYRDFGQVPEYIQGAASLNCFPNAAGVFTYYCGKLKPDPSQVSLNLPLVADGKQILDQTRAIANVAWRLGGWSLVGVGTYAVQNNDTFCDCDYSNQVPFAGAFHSDFVGRIEDQSAEIRLRSPETRHLRVLAGASIFHENSFSYRANAATIVIPYVTVTTKGVFGSIEYDLSRQLTLSVDGRYQNERQTRSAIPGNPAIDVTYEAFLPRAIIEYKPHTGLLLYASAAKGNQPGQFNTGTNIPTAQVRVDSEQLWSYEVGAKTDLFDNRLQLNLAAYHIDWTNQVYSTQIVGVDGRLVNILANLGGSRVNGVELDAGVRLAEGWTANATFAYTDARYVNFISANALRVYGNAQVAGSQLPNTPQVQGSFVTEYRRPVFADFAGFVRADYAYRGRQYVSEVNQAYIGDLHLLGAGIGIDNGHVRIAARVDNLLDADTPDFATRFTDLNSPGLSRFGFLIKLRTGRTATLSLQQRF